MKFKNLQNNYIEESSIPFLWTLLFGFLYFAYKRVWSHCLISFILAWLTVGFSWLIYPFFAKAIVRKSFLGTGWVELTRSGEEIKQNIDYSNGQKTSFILVVVLLVALGVAFYPSWFADFLDKKNITSTQETSQISENDLREMKENYISSTAEKIRKEWRYLGAEDHWSCDVHVIQTEAGDVLAVNIQNCTIDDSSKAKSFKDSIERAVYKASPLPIAPDQDLFDAEVMFHFSVD